MRVYHQSSRSLLSWNLLSENAQIEGGRPHLVLQSKRASLTLPLAWWNMSQQCALAAKEATSTLGSASAWRGHWCDLIAAFYYIRGGYREGGARPLAVVHGVRDSEHKLKWRRLWLDIRKNTSPSGQSGSGTGCTGALCSLHPWKFSRPNWTKLCTSSTDLIADLALGRALD